MATATVGNTTICSICCENLDTPKILPCGHTFCLCCIERCIADNRETFPCPFCKQEVKIPDGGAKDFTTNYIVKNHQPKKQREHPSTKQPKCPNHNQRVVDYYCNNCNVGLCLRCISKQHKEHETLDIECDETRYKAIAKLQRSQKSIKNRIKNLKKARSTLLESFEQVKSLCEDSCAKVTEKTEQIVSDLRKSCETIIKDIRKNLEENRIKVEDRTKEITSDINLIESNIESNISPSTKTTLNILLTLPRLAENKKLDESREDYNLCLQYLQWVGKDFSLAIDQLGSVISKPFYIPGSYQFLFNVSDVENDNTGYYSKNRFRNNNLIWSCRVERRLGGLNICVKLSSTNNRHPAGCIIDYKTSLLNFDDDSKTKTVTQSLTSDEWPFMLWNPIPWSKLIDTNNGYLNANGQFVVQLDTTIKTLTRGMCVIQ